MEKGRHASKPHKTKDESSFGKQKEKGKCLTGKVYSPFAGDIAHISSSVLSHNNKPIKF